MKKLFLIMINLTAFTSCKNQSEKTKEIINTEKISEKNIDLKGKYLEYNYGAYVYQLKFKTENQLHWKCVKGDEKGKEADETYVTQRLDSHTFFVSWIETDGLGVSQVINLKDNTIRCFLKIEKDIVPLSGTIIEL